MKKRLLSVLALSAAVSFAGPHQVQGEESKTLLGDTAPGRAVDRLISAGETSGEIGITARWESPDDGDSDDGGLAYFEPKWTSGKVHNLQFTIGGLITSRIWEDDTMLTDSYPDSQDGLLTEAYLTYSLPGTKTQFLLGRADDGVFYEPVHGDGDFYEGLGVRIDDIPRMTLHAHAVTAWLDNADTSPVSWDGLNNTGGGEDRWQDMDKVIQDQTGIQEDSGDAAYTVALEAEVLKDDLLNMTAALTTLEDVARSWSIAADSEVSLSREVSIGVRGVFATLLEDTPATVNDTDEDVEQYKVYGFVDVRGLEFGLGHYGQSNDRSVFNTATEGGDDFEDVFVGDEFDPVDEDLAKYGEQPNNNTYFLNAAWGYGPANLEIIYAWVDDAVIENGTLKEGEAQELNVILDLAWTETLSSEFYYAKVDDDYTKDGDRSADIFAMNLTHEF